MLRIFTDYYDTHEIPEERRYVPAKVIGEKYFFLKGKVVPKLLEALYNHFPIWLISN